MVLGEPEDPLGCDGLTISCRHQVRSSGLVLVPLAFDKDHLAGPNPWLVLNRGVLAPPSLPDFLEFLISEGKVFACVLVPGEVELTGREAMASDAIIQVGDRLAHD